MDLGPAASVLNLIMRENIHESPINLAQPTSSQREQEAIKHIVATIFSAQDALRDLAPEQRWTGMGNLLGDYGEYVALAKYDLKKAQSGNDGYDAVTADGLTVQIKANHSSSTIGFRGEADLLLVLKIERNAEWRELYYGPFKPVKEKATYSKRDNKYMIPVMRLAKLGESRR
jgi:hypothetical protein